MLQLETLPASLVGLLSVFRPCFTAPTFRTFAALVAGLVARQSVTPEVARAQWTDWIAASI